MGSGENAKRPGVKPFFASWCQRLRSIEAQPSEAELERALLSKPGSITALPQAPQRFDIEAQLLSWGGFAGWWRKLSWLVWGFPFMQKIRRDIVHSFTSVTANPSHSEREVTPQFLSRFTNLAYAHGIGAIGYTALPPEAIFQEKAVLYDKVIVLILEMDAAKMAQAPSRTTFRMVMQTYYELGRVVNLLVDFLRANGYAAQAGHPLNGVTLYPLVAQSAGLGWCGSNGLLITPEYGPRQRIGVIYTNGQNLPVTKDNDHSWIANLCARCGQCIRLCPSQAIYEEPVRHESGIVTHIDVDRCFPVFAAQYGCSLCIKVCPFNLYPYEEIKRRFFQGARARMTPRMV